ncbi:MAG: VCBS repeat-containing protein [Planctomycetaceae bacterium]
MKYLTGLMLFFLYCVNIPHVQAQAESPQLLKPLWQKSLYLHSPTNVVVGRVEDGVRLCVQGTRQSKDSAHAAIQILDGNGKRITMHIDSTFRPSSTVGAYLQWVDLSPQESPGVLYSLTPPETSEAGKSYLVSLDKSIPDRIIENTTHWGNNNSIVDDIDNDGQLDLLYADQQTLTLYTLPDLKQVWRWDQGIKFCWSLPGLFDLDSDGQREIVFGSEYNNEDGSSSVIAINSQGEQLWRADGFAEDLGSTTVYFADVDGDGTKEIIKVGLDLVHHLNQEWSHVFIFNASDGSLKSKFEFGCTGMTIGDLDGDGHIEGVGITNSRDGGNNGRKEIRCIDLVTGAIKWVTSVSRVYLDCNSPIMTDLDHDGDLEVIVGTGNPAGYARLPNSEPWGDLYVVDHQGEILQHNDLPGWPVNLAICDLGNDNQAELIVVQDGKPGALIVYETEAMTKRKDWVTPLGNSERSGNLGVEK